MTDISSAEVTDRMDRRAIDGSARVSDRDRLGLRGFVGYQWHESVGLEAGYTDLGEITTRFSDTDPALRAEDLRGVRPGSGRGAEAALVGRYPLATDWHALGRVGLLYWRASHGLEGGGSDSNTGTDAFFGLGVEYRFHEAWSARLSVDRYRVENDDTDFVGLGVSYHFGTRTSASPAAPSEPAPAEVHEAPAEAPVVVVEERQEIPLVVIPEPKPEPKPQPETWIVDYGVGLHDAVALDALLMELAQRATAHPEARLRITGHTDSTGPRAYNQRLSERRASNIAQALQEKGVPAERMEWEGRGIDEPVADNATEEGRARNRRVEIELRY